MPRKYDEPASDEDIEAFLRLLLEPAPVPSVQSLVSVLRQIDGLRDAGIFRPRHMLKSSPTTNQTEKT